MNVPSETDASLGDLPVWNLDSLYPSPEDPQVEKDLAWLEQACQAFESNHKGKLADMAGEAMADALAELEAIDGRASRLGQYFGLRSAQDTQDGERARQYGSVQSRMTNATRPLVFLALELCAISDEAMEAKLAESPRLARYRAWLARQRARRDHTLEETLEEYIHDRSPVSSSAWGRLFEEFHGGRRYEVDSESLSLQDAIDRMSDPDRARREAAWRGLAKGFDEDIRLHARVFNTLLKSKEIDDRWRRYERPETSRHIANDVEPEIVAALREAVVESYERVPHRYYRLKAKWLGLDALDAWDRNAPLPEARTRLYSWDEAKEIVLGAFGEFSPQMAEITERFFREGWIDAPSTPGKSSGAFCSPGPASGHPFVLLNYQGRIRDVMTLAHELGHAVHQTLAAPQGDLLANTPLTLAETASVFGESLVFEKLLENETEPDARRALLASRAEDMINTVVRQISFYDFELRMHARQREGELEAGTFGEIWMDVSRESLGQGIRLNDGYENFWCYVSHFVHVPFYVYAYAFGEGLVHALYGKYKEEPEGFVDRYMEMLSAGGSKRHRELLEPFGLNLADPAFWKTGLGVMEATIAEAESIG